jgi:hypothetical protein
MPIWVISPDRDKLSPYLSARTVWLAECIKLVEEVSNMQHSSGEHRLLPDPASHIHGFLSRPEPEEEDGVALDDLAVGATLDVETRHHTYHIKNLGDGRATIYGHPEYCPEPIQVEMIASDRGGEFPRMRFIGKGARLEFWHPERGIVRTSRIAEVREVSAVV